MKSALRLGQTFLTNPGTVSKIQKGICAFHIGLQLNRSSVVHVQFHHHTAALDHLREKIGEHNGAWPVIMKMTHMLEGNDAFEDMMEIPGSDMYCSVFQKW